MKKKTLDRMKKMVHEINNGPLSYPIRIKKLKPLIEQSNYNPLLREWTSGEREYEVIMETTGVFTAFKESETWEENGMLEIHDYKMTVNDDVIIDTNCIVERIDTNEIFEVIFRREYVGELAVGLRPVIK